MDSIDQEILFHLQQNARVSITELSKQVKLSAPAVNERIKKLEERNIITSYRAQIDPTALGQTVTAHVLMNTTRCHDFVQFCKQHPQIIECYRLAGQYDYLVKIITQSVETLEIFIDQCMAYGKPSTLIHLSEPVEHKPII